MNDLDGIYHNVPNGFVYSFQKLGWELLTVYDGTHHYENGQMLRWRGEGDPVYPKEWKQIEEVEVLEAKIVVITGDRVDDRAITLGRGDGTFQRWKITDSLLKKMRREINERLD